MGASPDRNSESQHSKDEIKKAAIQVVQPCVRPALAANATGRNAATDDVLDMLLAPPRGSTK